MCVKNVSHYVTNPGFEYHDGWSLDFGWKAGDIF